MKTSVLILLAALTSGCAVHNHYYTAGSNEGDKVEEAQEHQAHAVNDQDPLVDDRHEAASTLASPSNEEEPSEGGFDDRPVPSDTIAAQPKENRSSVFDGCQVKNHKTGWVMATCSGMKITLQTGPSARGNLGRLFAYAATLAADESATPAAYWGHREFRGLNGKRTEFVDYDLRKNQPAMFGTNTDPQGEILAHGIYTFAPSRKGKIGILCQQEGGFDLERCTDMIRDISNDALVDIGQLPGTTVTVVGKTLRSEGLCYFLRPNELGCPGGGVDWGDGSRQTVQAYIESNVAELTDPHGIENFHNPHIVTDCRIGDASTRCHEVRYNGVLQSPISITHIAHVDEKSGSTWVKCSYSTSGPAPNVCRDVFGI